MKHEVTTPEFSRAVDLENLGERGLDLAFEANARERAALAARFGLIELTSLRARLRIERARGRAAAAVPGAIAVSGTLDAAVVQTCVVTLEAFGSQVEESFSQLFGPADALPDEAEGAVSPFDDAPEQLLGGEIDVGELVAQQFSLALEPYPRRPGAALGDLAGQADAETPAETDHPFAVLGQLKGKM